MSKFNKNNKLLKENLGLNKSQLNSSFIRQFKNLLRTNPKLLTQALANIDGALPLEVVKRLTSQPQKGVKRENRSPEAVKATTIGVAPKNKNSTLVGMPDISKDSSRFLQVANFVLGSILDSNPINRTVYSEMLQATDSWFRKLIKDHGITEGTKRYKESTNNCILYAERRPVGPQVNTWYATVGKAETPIPLALKPLRVLIDKVRDRSEDFPWRKAYQALITILSYPRLSTSLPECDIKSITDPLKVPDMDAYKSVTNDFRKFVKSFKLHSMPLPWSSQSEAKDYFVSPSLRMTFGPSGKPTIASAVQEAKLLLNEKRLWMAFTNFCVKTSNNEFLTYVEKLGQLPVMANDGSDTCRLGFVTQVTSPMNKNRIVAMIDYWSNLLLAPLEAFVKNTLSIDFHKNDYLRNHSHGTELVKDWSKSYDCFSLDLSSWTDRFPVELQEPVVERLLGKGLGQDWRILLTSRNFWISEPGVYIQYHVGQPMGSKSSFAVASLTHHLFIHYCASLLKKEGVVLDHVSDLYVIVGDDLVIRDAALAQKVRDVYTIIGVEISDSKSKIPVEGCRFTEFCSRISIDGVDVSRISPLLIRNASLNWKEIPTLLLEMRKREVKPNMDLLKGVTYLLKEEKSTKLSYLSLLKSVMQYPLMGNDLSDLALEIEAEPIKVNFSKETVESLVKASTALQLFEQLTTSMKELEDFVKKDHTKNKKDMANIQDSSSEAFMRTDGALRFQRNLANGTLKSDVNWKLDSHLMTSSNIAIFRKEGWSHDIPHPASIAACWLYHLCWDKDRTVLSRLTIGVDPSTLRSLYEARGVPVPRYLMSLSDNSFEGILHWGQKLIGGVSPKRAEMFTPNKFKSSGSDFMRNQIFLYLKYLKVLSKVSSGEAVVVTPSYQLKIKSFELEKDVFRIPLDSVLDWGKSPQNFRELVENTGIFFEARTDRVVSNPLHDPSPEASNHTS